MNQSDNTKFVDFTKCEKCIHYEEEDSLICDECLLEPVNYESTTPVNFKLDESKKEKENDK